MLRLSHRAAARAALRVRGLSTFSFAADGALQLDLGGLSAAPETGSRVHAGSAAAAATLRHRSLFFLHAIRAPAPSHRAPG